MKNILRTFLTALLVPVGFLGVSMAAQAESNCLDDGHGTGCDDQACEDTICGIDSYCCEFAWDNRCVSEASDMCFQEIDIKPGSYPNSINTNSCNGVIPVAILGTETIDVAHIDVTTLRFGPGGASPAHDLSNPYTLADHQQDVNDDYVTDLVSHYQCSESGIESGDTEACLTANIGVTPYDSNCYSSHAGVGCDTQACEDTICAYDSYCCTDVWDGQCASEAENDCPPKYVDTNCIVAHGSTGCDDSACEASVCAFDPYCCIVTWDGFCASEGMSICSFPPLRTFEACDSVRTVGDNSH